MSSFHVQRFWPIHLHLISFLYVCLVNTIYLLSFVETPRKFIIAELSIRKLGSSSVLIILIRIYNIYTDNTDMILRYTISIISTDEDPSLRIESSAIINLRGVSTKLNKNIFICSYYMPISSQTCFAISTITSLFHNTLEQLSSILLITCDMSI